MEPPAAACQPRGVARTESPDFAWARSGAMELAGMPDGAPRLAPAPLALWAEAQATRLRRLAPALPLDGAALLGERAALRGLGRRGRTAPGGVCRLLRARDGWVAVNLARPDDAELLPAWFENAAPAALECEVGARTVATLVERARLLGLAVAPAASPDRRDATPPHRVQVRGRAGPPRHAGSLRVLDLSSLWAGPLAGQLLALAGAEVVKVECRTRPDGARRGSRAFHDLLNAPKASVALDFRAPQDRVLLRGLLRAADVVIESARPRALRQLGIDAEACVREQGSVWVSITGHGRADPEAHWVAFGDDAAAAAGLCAAAGDADGPLFCGDAIADPLAGLHAAVAALEAARSGTGALLDVSLRGVVAHVLARPEPCGVARVERTPDGAGWIARDGARIEPVMAPRARAAIGSARSLGADTGTVLRAWLGPRRDRPAPAARC